jgi:pyruvate formate lyase activating enzyme
MENRLPEIRGYLPTTLIDWPGRMAAVLFLGGCNLRCGYCHAGHLLRPTVKGESISAERVLEHLVTNAGWLDGVVVSGGEPTLDLRAAALLGALRRLGFDVKLDTNGTTPETLRCWVDEGLVQAVAMDVKAPFDRRYRETVRRPVDLDAVWESARFLLDGSLEYEFRTTVCTRYTTVEDVRAIAHDISGASYYVLQAYRHLAPLDPTLSPADAPSFAELEAMVSAAAPFVGSCYVRGHKPVSPRLQGL